MDVSMICNNTIATPSIQGLGFAKLLSRPNSYVSLSDASSDHPLPSLQPFRASTPPQARSKSRTIRRRRTRRRLLKGDDSGDDEDFGYYVDLTSEDSFWYYVNPGGDGPAGGGFGFNNGRGGGGDGWNSDQSDGQNQEDPSPPAPQSSGFGFNFFHEVIYWIALSSCLHFAIKKLVRLIAAAILTLKDWVKLLFRSDKQLDETSKPL